MRNLVLVALLGSVVWSVPVEAAFELVPLGPRAAAMGAAGVALGGDHWCMLRNPALLVTSRPGAGFSWSEQFGLPELARETITAGTRIRSVNVAVRAGTMGTNVYREGEFGLSFAKRIASEFAAGLEIGGHWLDIEGFRSSRVVTVTVGAAATPIPGLHAGAVWRNLNEPKLPGYRDRVRESLTLGLAADVGENGIIAGDIVQEEFFPAEYRLGAEAKVLKGLYLRVGGRAEPVRPSVGFQVDVGRWGFSYAGDLHPDLGASHEFGLEVRFGQ